jgi:TonB family protein
MLKRANTWDLQPDLKPELVKSSRNSGSQNNGEPPAPRKNGPIPSFQYELSPRRWDRLGTSVVVHVVALFLIVRVATLIPIAKEKPAVTHVTPLVAPQLSHPPKILPPPPAVLAKLQPPPQPKIELPTPAPTPEPPKIEPPKVEMKQPTPPAPVEVAKAFPAPDIPKPVPPKKEVVVNTFDSGSSVPATVKEPARKVQTGGFGDPNGTPATSDKKSPVQMASLGSFDMPGGPGNGNGTAGKRGIEGTVKSAGFGDGSAGNGSADHGPRTVSTGSFSDNTAVASAPKAAAAAKPDVTPVEITYKPRPVYTEEARQMHVQGEVLLEVMFTASGELKIQRVVRGLGHGLDEAAEKAATQIRFRPAKRDGQPYDSVALVHINFELAE